MVIGIDRYQNDKYKNLNNAVLGCEHLINELTQNYGFELIVEPIYNESATQKNIIEKLSSLQFSIFKEDNLIIYFAGHGQINTHTNKGAWIPFDASDSAVDYIPNILIKDKIEDIDAKHIFLISDSCFSGTFLTRSVNNNFDISYEKLDSKKSRWYLASGGIETVSDGKPGQGSPFTNSLIEQLTNNRNKYITILELSNEVILKTGNIANQQPVYGEIKNGGHENGQMILVRTDINKNKSSITENKISNEDFNIHMKTYGYFLGQSKTLDTIENKFPQLRRDVLKVKTEWAITYSTSPENIVEKLRGILGDSWEKYEDMVTKHFEKYLKNDDISFEEAIEFLKEVSLRANGEIPSPILECLLANKTEYRIDPIKEFINNFRKTLKSNNNEKSTGFDFQVEIPLSWTVKEGKRPHVLWLTNNFDKTVLATFTVVSNPDIIQENWTREMLKEIADIKLNSEYIYEMIASEKINKISEKRIIIDGCHGIILEFEDEFKRIDYNATFYFKQYFITYKHFDLIVSFQIDKKYIDLNKAKEVYSQFFNLIMNSLIINKF
ncbi:caspase family protein [Emticicia oligotrophica]|nr:caspase family protein [Emticicia oligotrophica]